VTTIDSTRPSNRKYLITGAAVIAVAVAAYGLGRVYPPLGPVEGTIAPSGRYISPQVGAPRVRRHHAPATPSWPSATTATIVRVIPW